ncbi:MAG: hypothetical protein ACYS1C_10840, partial [Planctomycetota bacterium]
MKLKCRCGHDLNVAEQDSVARCLYCGMAYGVSRDAAGMLTGRPLKRTDSEVPTQRADQEWPGELELDLPEQAPVGPGPQQRPRPATPPGQLELDVPEVRQEQGAAPSAPAAGPAPGATQPAAEPERRGWWLYLGTAWAYPFSGKAKWTLLGWLLVSVFVAPFLSFLPLVGWLVPFVLLGVLVLYEFELIRQSSYDAEAAPSLPAWEDFYESALRPLGQLLAAFAGGAIPFFAALLIIKYVGKIGIEEALVKGVVGQLPSEWLRVLLGGLALSAFMLPMNVLAVATADSAGAVNPKFTFPAVLKVPVPYLVCAGFCAFCVVAGFRLRAAIALAMGA